MSGNYDYPPATDSNSSSAPHGTDASNLPARLQHIRQALQREREQQRTMNEVEASERRSGLNRLGMASSSPPRRRRGTNRRSAADTADRASGSSSPAPASDPLQPAARNRPRAQPSQRYSAMRRAMQQREQLLHRETAGEVLTDLEQATERLTEMSQRLDILSQQTDISNSELLRMEFGDDESSGRRATKRRKLDHGDSQIVKPHRYGHFGQVVSGRLKMEIVSCDGGTFDDSNADLHRVENALTRDASVYCTKKSHCNLLLRHHDETNFCLDKIVIKAPERGFTAPVQEGMVFISMDSDDLINGASAYQIHYGNPSMASSRINSPSSSVRPERISLLESLQDPEVLAGSLARRNRHHYRSYQNHGSSQDLEQRLREERHARFARLLRMRRRIENSGRQSTNRLTLLENCENEPTSTAPLISPSAPTPPPFTVTTDQDDTSSESEQEQPSASVMADRLRRDSRWRGDTDDEDDEEDARNMNIFWDTRPAFRTQRGSVLRSERRSTPSKIEPDESSAQEGELLAPHARFFMKKNQSKITIRFDPPVSGKFILLKLWSPSPDGNIDIQNITAHGFSGPRYFPACEMR
ncbi:hypothetical protein K490DRAFT_57435 [Saccharata proteae CBS 121410]|uniref:Uncharacterized protein n=1 Tax=Saccharata proteae CBS 121410 TaxID=1314787 RepID=A0A9P4LYC2_9PEZI|nr:hypothetical protein K490DRAFT_57435 [Saccharata proteae CBS 121410]